VTKTEQLINGSLTLDTFHQVDVEEIRSLWTPGDFKTWENDMYCDCLGRWAYHDCELTFPERWSIMIDRVFWDDRYQDVLEGIRQYGFLKPIGAMVGHNGQHIVLCDGHHRVTVALELGIKEVPVYIARQGTDVFDLVALDSGYWNRRSRSVDSPFDYVVG